jgi:hypothetical protein
VGKCLLEQFGFDLNTYGVAKSFEVHANFRLVRPDVG